MKKAPVKKFEHEICGSCGQTTDYDMSLGKGHALIVLAIYRAIERLGRNRVHLNDEMLARQEDFPSMRAMVDAGRVTHTMINNTSCPRYHGLIAFGSDTGEYLLTPKGADFLFRNRAIPRTAVIDKKTHSKKYYLDPEDTVTFGDLMRGENHWAFNDQTIAKLGLGPVEFPNPSGQLFA